MNGGEVKSVRAGQANMNDAHARIRNGEIWLHGLHIAPYFGSGQASYEPTRPRKLLLHKKQVVQLAGKLQEQGLSLIPTKIYLTHNRIKVELALAKGKKKYDKRASLKRKESQREISRKLRIKQ